MDANAGDMPKRAHSDCQHCKPRFKAVNTSPSPCNGSGYPNWEAKSCGLWACPESKTGSSKWHCATLSNPYSSATLPNTATVSGLAEEPKTRSGESLNSSSKAKGG